MKYIRLPSTPVIVLFFLILFLAKNANSQPVKLGLNGGLNISSHLNNFKFLSGDINLDFKPKVTIGYQGGLIIRKDFSNLFRLQAEPTVILLGARYDEPFLLRGFDFKTKSRTKLWYIQLPLVFQLSTVPSKNTVYGRQFAKTTYHLTGGVFGGYLWDAHFSGTNTGAPIGISFEDKFSNDVSSQYSNMDGGVIFGVGLENGVKSKFGIETRILYSIMNSGDAPDLSFDPQNIALTFSIYYLL